MQTSKWTKAALSDQVYECALSVIKDESYDIIMYGFLPSDFANAARDVFQNMLQEANGGYVFNKESFSIHTLGYQWKICNCKPCYVSCSCSSSTGVGRTEAPFILPGIYGLEPSDVKVLLDMMNEAWYLMIKA